MVKIQGKPGGTMFNRKGQYLLCADDVLIVGRAMKHVAETVEDMTI
jgi:hypothetical protein